MGASPDSGVSPLVQLLPFALVLAIFYFVILLPMRRRQKKVQEFLDALKVGDKVVTSGGLYGVVTKLGNGRSRYRLPTVCASRSRAPPSSATRARIRWSRTARAVDQTCGRVPRPPRTTPGRQPFIDSKKTA